MVGLLDDLSKKMTLHFKEAGDWIVMLGVSRNDINSSEYLHKIKGVEYSPAPHFDLEEEYRLHQLIIHLIQKGAVQSVHDISEGGLFVNLLESSFFGEKGFDVTTSDQTIRKDAFWFGEAQSRAVVTLHSTHLEAFKQLAGNHPYSVLGKVTDGEIKIDADSWGKVAAWKKQYEEALEKIMGIIA
jgi:phosphoribosylformylglycinamidine synthase